MKFIRFALFASVCSGATLPPATAGQLEEREHHAISVNGDEEFAHSSDIVSAVWPPWMCQSLLQP